MYSSCSTVENKFKNFKKGACNQPQILKMNYKFKDQSKKWPDNNIRKT